MRIARTLATAAAGATSALALSACGGAGTPITTHRVVSSTRRAEHASPSRPPQVLPAARGSAPTAFVPAVLWRGQTAAWIARSRSGVALISFDQRVVTLALHSGTIDAGGSGWRWGPSAAGPERVRLIAAFNGGFKLDTGDGGFMSGGRTAVSLRSGLGSIVTYADGFTDIGAWHRQVPVPSRPLASVRQNLTLLIDHGAAAASRDCVSCWGATLGGVADPARSALGITADGHLVWAAGEHVTVGQLADALLAARVVRAVELDINPEWVAGYLYRHHVGANVLPTPVVPGQPGAPGAFLAPYSRDFFTVLTR
jgi:hypothetical protein